MKTGDVLNADLQTVGRWLEAGWRWWTGEIAGLMPRRWRHWRQARPTARRRSDGFEIMSHGKVLAAAPGARRSLKVDLVLEAGAVLLRTIPVPVLPRRDVVQMVMLDISRLTPFRADQVFVDIELDQAEPRRARLAVVRRSTALALVDQARAANLDPQRLAVAAADAAYFDFMPALAGQGATGPRGAARAIAWGVAAVLLLANVAVAIWLDVDDLERLGARVDAQRPLLGVANGVRSKVQATDAMRRQLLADRIGREPLSVINAVTRALPDGAWVQRFGWDGRSIRMTGYARAEVDVLAALRREPRFTNVRAATGEQAVPLTTGKPFDIVADLKGQAR